MGTNCTKSKALCCLIRLSRCTCVVLQRSLRDHWSRRASFISWLCPPILQEEVSSIQESRLCSTEPSSTTLVKSISICVSTMTWRSRTATWQYCCAQTTSQCWSWTAFCGTLLYSRNPTLQQRHDCAWITNSPSGRLDHASRTTIQIRTYCIFAHRSPLLPNQIIICIILVCYLYLNTTFKITQAHMRSLQAS